MPRNWQCEHLSPFEAAQHEFSSKNLLGTVQHLASSTDHLGGCFYLPPTCIKVFVAPIILEICNWCLHNNLATTPLCTESSF